MIIRICAILAMLTIGGASAVMNARFGWQLGEDDLARWILMVLSIAIDVAKWVMPIEAAAALRQRAYARAAAAILLWVVAGVWSFSAAVGFAALNRDLTIAGRSQGIDTRARAEVAWRTAQTTLTTLQSSPRWSATQACTNATAPASVSFCAEVRAARATLADAEQRLHTGHAIASADPQGEFLARTFGLSLASAQLILTLMVAVTAELMTMLGFFAVTGPAPHAVAIAPKASQTPAEKVLPVGRRETPPAVNTASLAPPAAPSAPGPVMKQRPPRIPQRTPLEDR